jgi:ABC-type branched-subunit amino acid transport system substrate-binding protein
MKKTILILLGCFLAAVVWQHHNLSVFFKNQLDLSWFSFAGEDYAAARVAYMTSGVGPVKIAFIAPPSSMQTGAEHFFEDAFNGAALAAEQIAPTLGKGRKIELATVICDPEDLSGSQAITTLGSDPSVLAVILPSSHTAQLESEVNAEYLGLLIFHAGGLLTAREQESSLAFDNTYPMSHFSEKIASDAAKRGIQSVLMLTEKNRDGQYAATNQDFWFSKKGVPVPASFLYEKNMIDGTMLEELSKKVGILGTDAIYWGSALKLKALSDAMRRLSAKKPAEHFMYLPMVTDNNPALKKILEQLESSALDAVVAYPVVADPRQQEAFDKLYQAKHQVGGNYAAYYGYDTFMLLADCLRKKNTASPQDIAQSLTESGYKGILATYQFTENGILDDQAAANIRLGKIKNGALVELASERAPSAENRPMRTEQ